MRSSLNCNAFDPHTCEPASFTIRHTEEYYVCFWGYLTWGFLLLPRWESIPTTCASLKPSKLYKAQPVPPASHFCIKRQERPAIPECHLISNNMNKMHAPPSSSSGAFSGHMNIFRKQERNSEKGIVNNSYRLVVHKRAQVFSNFSPVIPKDFILLSGLCWHK